jgi:hypothetical protein
MAYASDADLIDYVSDIFEHGIETFEAELAASTSDIQRKIKGEWFGTQHSVSTFNPDLLDASQWVRANVYHSLAYYILPKLANFGEGDTFLNMMAFYRDRFATEYSEVMRAGINYDFNADESYDEADTSYVTSNRLDR